MLAEGTAVWMRIRVEACANAEPLASAVPAAPAATPFSSERRNIWPPYSNRWGPRSVCSAAPAHGLAPTDFAACARDTIGDLRRARHRFDSSDACRRAGLNRPPRLALAAARARGHNRAVLGQWEARG